MSLGGGGGERRSVYMMVGSLEYCAFELVKVGFVLERQGSVVVVCIFPLVVDPSFLQV